MHTNTDSCKKNNGFLALSLACHAARGCSRSRGVIIIVAGGTLHYTLNERNALKNRETSGI